MADGTSNELITLTADIVSAHVSNNSVPSSEVANLIQGIYAALSSLGTPAEPTAPEKPQGATTARKSLSSPDHIISMIDGKPYKMLKRHLGQNGHTPQSYREAFGLPKDYPMVAKSYAETRSALARKIGLGRKPAAPVAKPAPRARKPKAAPAAE